MRQVEGNKRYHGSELSCFARVVISLCHMPHLHFHASMHDQTETLAGMLLAQADSTPHMLPSPCVSTHMQPDPDSRELAYSLILTLGEVCSPCRIGSIAVQGQHAKQHRCD
jgi:hypothetical protein